MSLEPTQTLPPHYLPKGSLDLSKNVTLALILNLCGAVLLLFFGWLMVRLLFFIRPEVFQTDSFEFTLTFFDWRLWAWVVSLIVIQAAVIMAHEGVHGFFFWWFSHQKPVYAFKGLYAYAALPGWYIPKQQYLVVALAPFFVLTLVGVGLMSFVPAVWLAPLGIFVVINAAGAVGDLAVAGWLVFLPPNTYALDQGDALTMYLPQPTGQVGE